MLCGLPFNPFNDIHGNIQNHFPALNFKNSSVIKRNTNDQWRYDFCMYTYLNFADEKVVSGRNWMNVC